MLGEHREVDFEAADMVVRSPAVPPSSRFLRLAADHGAEVETELSFAMRALDAQLVIGVTGSNGKTTTTAMITAILNHACKPPRRVWEAGNMGRPLLDYVDRIGPDDVVCLELSSFQLEDLHRLERSPDIAVLTNLTPNHLDRHGSFEAYDAAKRAIYQYQTESGWLILNARDPASASWISTAPGKVARFCANTTPPPLDAFVGLEPDGQSIITNIGDETCHLFSANDLAVPGEHNLENAMAAATAAMIAGAPAASIRPALSAFCGVAHRLELVADKDGRRFVNDSIATSPEAAAVAIAAVPPPVVLLAGGSDKGLPFDGLAEAVVRHGVRVVTFGATRRMLANAIHEALDRHPNAAPEPTLAKNLDEAFHKAVATAPANATILLAPACASFDQFRNFQQRGERFRSLVAELGASAASSNDVVN